MDTSVPFIPSASWLYSCVGRSRQERAASSRSSAASHHEDETQLLTACSIIFIPPDRSTHDRPAAVAPYGTIVLANSSIISTSTESARSCRSRFRHLAHTPIPLPQCIDRPGNLDPVRDIRSLQQQANVVSRLPA